jgi:hypothetical protein
MAIVKMAKDEASTEAIDELVGALANVDRLTERYEQLPWAPPELGMDIMTCLEDVGSKLSDHAASRLMLLIDKPDAHASTWVAGALVQAMFRESAETDEYQDLSAEQTKALEAIVRYESFWTEPKQMAWLLGASKLPESRDELRELVDGRGTQQP